MTDTSQTQTERWTNLRAITLSVLCLVVGIAGGWLLRGAQQPKITRFVNAADIATPGTMGGSSSTGMPGSGQLKEMADAQAAPMITQLQSDPGNQALLVSVGNLYYDAQQYPTSVDYYQRALKIKPSDAAVRTDMATAYWYMGNADAAITELNKALVYEPNKPNALFNLGLVKWHGKKDVAGALADWDKLLASNPNYEARDKVEAMIAEAKKDQASAARMN